MRYGVEWDKVESPLSERERVSEAQKFIHGMTDFLKESPAFQDIIADSYWDEKPHDQIEQRNPYISFDQGEKHYRIAYNRTDLAQLLHIEKMSVDTSSRVAIPEEDVLIALGKKQKSDKAYVQGEIRYRSHSLRDFERGFSMNTPQAVEKVKTFLEGVKQ